jgi:hypothetical protein
MGKLSKSPFLFLRWSKIDFIGHECALHQRLKHDGQKGRRNKEFHCSRNVNFFSNEEQSDFESADQWFHVNKHFWSNDFRV